MLTDRQQQFKEEIQNLLLVSSSATFEEKQYLREAADSLEKENPNFKVIINNLMVDLDIRKKNIQGGLTEQTNILLKRLIFAYGEPEYNAEKIGWEFKDPDYVFVGGGRSGHWRKREPEPHGSKKSRFVAWLKGLLVLFAIIIFWMSSFPELLTNKFGDNGNYISLTITFLILATASIVFGRFKKK